MDYNLFLDSDVILDIVLQREEFFQNSYQIFKMAEDQTALLYTSSSIVMNVQYLSAKFVGKKKAAEGIKYLLDFLDILDCNKKILQKAYNTKCKDIEDAVQYFTAIHSELITFFISRNVKDYTEIEEKFLPALTPSQFLKLFK
ncbi:MAG: PIN domain-containing protein [Bacteroidota bacterium]|nr:PIN domain-containing protein [Bacteroidota bacterium]